MKEVELDTRGLLCPLPVIKVQNKIKELQAGDILKVVATDPGTQQDIPSWCRIYHQKLLEKFEKDHEFWFVIAIS